MKLLLRVLASFSYDLLILAALSMLLAGLFTWLTGAGFHEREMPRTYFQISWLAMIAAYYALSWRFGGQTIGMKAWKLRVTGAQAGLLSWHEVKKRLLFATLNLITLNLGWLGYLLPNKRSLTDHFSATQIEHMAKKS